MKLEDKLGDWYPLIGHHFTKELAGVIAKRRTVTTVYPDKDKVFRAFELCQPKDIKVIILGQD